MCVKYSYFINHFLTQKEKMKRLKNNFVLSLFVSLLYKL